jgi:hypothetical protein
MELNEFENFNFVGNIIDEKTLDVKFDVNQLVEKIKISLENVLQQRFPSDPIKSVLDPFKQSPKEFNFSCPYCGDSQSNARNQRGHIFFNNMAYKCHNGGCTKGFGSLYNFLKDFNQLDLFDTYEQYYIRSNFSQKSNDSNSISNNSTEFRSKSTNKIHEILAINNYAIPRNDIMKQMKLVEVRSSMACMKMLEKRKQIQQDMRHFAYNSYFGNLYVFNLSSDKNGVIGIQIRYDKPFNGRRFRSYQYSDIWEDVFKSGTVKEEIKQKINRLSLIYNILHIDYNKPVGVFEGSIDSHHYPNSIATWSANTHFYLPTGRYFYDNTTIDEAGLKESIKMIEKGYYVFLWDKFLREYPRYRKCKDLNDIFKLEPIKIEILNEYFSNDPLDMIYL